MTTDTGWKKNLTLIYWDYYHTEIKTYRKMIERHKAIGNPVTFVR